jgi:hypothetical protein
VSLCISVESIWAILLTVKIIVVSNMVIGTVERCINLSLHNQMYAFCIRRSVRNCRLAFTVFSVSILNFSFSCVTFLNKEVVAYLGCSNVSVQ